jgi:5-methylcytosine-specific restriction endonuclease McrA
MLTPLLIGSSIVLLVVVVLYIRAKIIDSNIIKNSKKIALINKLNDSTKFHSVSKSIRISKHYDNKSHYNKIEPGYLMSAEIRNNIEKFSSYISKIKENRNNRIIYINKIKDIISKPTEFEIEKPKILQNEYLYRENKLIRKSVLEPIVQCTFCVYMYYSSSKGQVNLSKSDCFSFDDLVASYESVSRTILDKSTYSKIALVERGEISDSLRYDILNRDNFKCVICGASSREGARLHVDHIIPVSKGGKSSPDNLRTLCERCNIGKSNKLENIEIDEYVMGNNETIRCPKCGGELVLRHGKHGDFYGCSNYPKCKFTRSI